MNLEDRPREGLVRNFDGHLDDAVFHEDFLADEVADRAGRIEIARRTVKRGMPRAVAALAFEVDEADLNG